MKMAKDDPPFTAQFSRLSVCDSPTRRSPRAPTAHEPNTSHSRRTQHPAMNANGNYSSASPEAVGFTYTNGHSNGVHYGHSRQHSADTTTSSGSGGSNWSSKTPVSPIMPAQAPQQMGNGSSSGYYKLEVDESQEDSELDADIALEDYLDRRSVSLKESGARHRQEHGRRYHAQNTTYTLPYANEDLEAERLDLQHHLFLLTLNGRLHRAPISKNTQNVLDLGTGTGIWATDFADQYPKARVIGSDLSLPQRPHVPSNCRFEVRDAESDAGWAFPAGQKFDYIHGRMLVVGIRDWSSLLRRAYAALKPGGWLEIQDLQFPILCSDSSADSSSPPIKWSHYMLEGARNLGLDLSVAKDFPTLFRQTGFANVREERNAWPIGTWPKNPREKEKGVWALQNVTDGLEAFSMAIYTKGLGWRPQEVNIWLSSVDMALRDRRSHCYLPLTVVYAQKPL